MWKIVVYGLAAILLLAACAASSTSQEAASESDLPSITVYKPPT